MDKRFDAVKVFCRDCGKEQWKGVEQERKASVVLEYITSGIPVLCSKCSTRYA